MTFPPRRHIVPILSILTAAVALTSFLACKKDGTVNPPPGDVTPPSRIVDLTAESRDHGVVLLAWTAPGDDGAVGQAARYELRSHARAITAANWDSAAVITEAPAPQSSGRPENLGLDDLGYGTWHFAIRAVDDAENASDLSNDASATLVDATPPAAVLDLALAAADGDSVALTWTAPGGDGNSGRAASYELRHATDELTPESFDQGTLVTGLAAPASAGNAERVTVRGLDLSVEQFFALRSIDGAGNASPISNVVRNNPAGLVELVPAAGIHTGATSPAWSPDGAWILFQSDRSADQHEHIYRVPAAGGPVVPMTLGAGWEYSPTWSSDASEFLFIRELEGSDGPRELVTARPTPGAVQRLRLTFVGRNIRSARWSPDGTQVLFVAYSFTPERIVPEIFVGDLLTGTSAHWSPQVEDDDASTWSPDGERIAFESNRSGNVEIWAAPTAGGDARQLTKSSAGNYTPCWSPDGQRIAFSSDREGGNLDIWIMNADGTNPVRVTTAPEPEWDPSWSPDGRHIAFTQRAPGSVGSIWRVAVRNL